MMLVQYNTFFYVSNNIFPNSQSLIGKQNSKVIKHNQSSFSINFGMMSWMEAFQKVSFKI